jgi:hypothetical protein
MSTAGALVSVFFVPVIHIPGHYFLYKSLDKRRADNLTSQFYEIDSESTTQEKLMLPQEV